MWQLIAIVSGASVTLLMAVANVAYSMSLASGATLGIPNQYLFALLGIALDLSLIVCTFAYQKGDETQKALCAALFIIASLYSIHSLHGYLTLNTGTGRVQDTIQTSLLAELKAKEVQAQQLKGQQLTRAYQDIEQLRARLTTPPVLPLQGFEWFIAIALWFFNATCWRAWFSISLTHESQPRIKQEATHGDRSNGKVAKQVPHVGRDSSTHRRKLF